MRWFVVFAAITAALGLGAAMAGSTPTSSGPTLSCAKGSVRAVIGGKQTCLRVGQRCAKQFDRAYRRYRFQCVSGRLTRVRPPDPQTPVTVTLQPVDGPGVSGTAILTPLDLNHTKVTLEVVNGPPGDLPAHIHFDTCKNVSAIRFGLSNVVDGNSESTISAGIDYLRRGHGAFSFMVHKAEPNLPIIACGDIPPG